MIPHELYPGIDTMAWKFYFRLWVATGLHVHELTLGWFYWSWDLFWCASSSVLLSIHTSSLSFSSFCSSFLLSFEGGTLPSPWGGIINLEFSYRRCMAAKWPEIVKSELGQEERSMVGFTETLAGRLPHMNPSSIQKYYYYQH